MTRKRKARDVPQDHAKPQEKMPDPVDMTDGIPDRCQEPARWKLLLIAVIFLAWLSLLVYCAAAGNP